MCEIQVSDTLWIHEEENSNVMIPSTEYGEPLDNMEVAMYCPIRLPAEPKEVTYGPRGASVIVTPPSRPSVPSSIAGSLLEQGTIASQAPTPLVAVSRPIKNPKPTTGMILAPNCNNQIHAIRSVGLIASLHLLIDQNRVQFCMT